MARLLWPTLAVIALVLLDVAARAQPSSLASSTPTSRPPFLVMLRREAKKLMDMQAQELAGEIGPPPGNCRVDVTHIEDDELGEGFAEFVADVFNRAYWTVEVSPVEQLASAMPGMLIQFSPLTATAAAKLQAALSQRETTSIAPIVGSDRQSCSLHITVGPQFSE